MQEPSVQSHAMEVQDMYEYNIWLTVQGNKILL